MKIRHLLAASVAAFVTVGSAQAADIIYQEPIPMAFSWQGFYFGGELGGSWSKSKIEGRGFAAPPVDHRFSPKASGFVGGIYAGYNFDAGNNVILGLDTDFVWGDMDDKSRLWTADNTHYYEGKIKQKWNGATRVRFGYGYDRWLPYLAVGVAYGKVKANLYDRTLADGTELTRGIDKNMTGWTIGAGTEYAVTDNVLVRLEYRYTDLGDKSFGLKEELHGKVKYKTHDVRVGVAYKF